MKMKKTRRGAAAVAIGASVLGGGALGVAFTSPLGAGAATPTEVTATQSTDATDATPSKTPPWVAQVLDGLVTDGTLTQAQRDTVQASLEAARPEGEPGGPGGPGGHHGRHGRGGPGIDAAATALGLSSDELRTALEGGSTIADVATERSIELQVVIDALVADMNQHLDQAVADGRLTQEQADARKATAADRATAMVNGEHPDGRRGPVDESQSAPSETTTTTGG